MKKLMVWVAVVLMNASADYALYKLGIAERGYWAFGGEYFAMAWIAFLTIAGAVKLIHLIDPKKSSVPIIKK